MPINPDRQYLTALSAAKNTLVSLVISAIRRPLTMPSSTGSAARGPPCKHVCTNMELLLDVSAVQRVRVCARPTYVSHHVCKRLSCDETVGVRRLLNAFCTGRQECSIVDSWISPGVCVRVCEREREKLYSNRTQRVCFRLPLIGTSHCSACLLEPWWSMRAGTWPASYIFTNLLCIDEERGQGGQWSRNFGHNEGARKGAHNSLLYPPPPRFVDVVPFP